jgi:hypothetical protein
VSSEVQRGREDVSDSLQQRRTQKLEWTTSWPQVWAWSRCDGAKANLVVRRMATDSSDSLAGRLRYEVSPFEVGSVPIDIPSKIHASCSGKVMAQQLAIHVRTVFQHLLTDDESFTHSAQCSASWKVHFTLGSALSGNQSNSSRPCSQEVKSHCHLEVDTKPIARSKIAFPKHGVEGIGETTVQGVSNRRPRQNSIFPSAKCSCHLCPLNKANALNPYTQKIQCEHHRDWASWEWRSPLSPSIPLTIWTNVEIYFSRDLRFEL